MFNKIFRQILLKFYMDKLKENCEWCVYDPYTILIMIQINEDCKKQMQRVYRMTILDSFLHKLSIYVLWPRFSHIFDLHLDNIQMCEVRNYKLNNHAGLHIMTTVRCYQFLIGLLKLQEAMNLSEQNNMLRQRYSRCLIEVKTLVKRMADEHFMQLKDRYIFLVNNFEFLVIELNKNNFKKCKNDVQVLQKDLEGQMEKLIETYLTLNFEELYKLVYPFTPDGQEESSKKAQEDLVTKDSVKHLKAAELESMGKDFLKNYKQKVEQIIKDIRNNVSNTSFQLDASKKQ